MAKRRANGEGSIRKRPDGRWEGRYTAGWESRIGKALYHSPLPSTEAGFLRLKKGALRPYFH